VRSAGRSLAWTAGLLGALLHLSAARAQISPGPLSRAHTKLEGSRQCLACHRQGRGVDPALCLDCHAGLAARVAAAKGLHARSEYATCARCHPEHGGEEFELVEWPDDGRAAFDHRLTGWELAGKHARVACDECHRRDRIDPELLGSEPRAPPRVTHLGLSTGCTDCHQDPHRGSLASRSCESCHGQETWKEPKGFDHAVTRFPLDGPHVRTACAGCHPPAAEGEPPRIFDQFRGRATAPACADCHRDPHEGRLGADCARCHAGNTFRAAVTRGFDHDRTRYPLLGRHRAVACERCHPAGKSLRVDYERCAVCHADPHLGQLADAAGGAACDACHSIEGFRPARFGLAEHDRSSFPLAGAHRAVPCGACHEARPASELQVAFARADRRAVVPFRGLGRICADCHRDPHGGELDRFAGTEGCRACHDQTSWRAARFDHERSRFPLRGAHARVECAKCHAPGTRDFVRFSGRPLDCAGCHRDEHAGQFALAGAGTDCARCHGVERFRPAPGFDHATTRFPLDGRHVAVACARCHPSERFDDREVVRYSPRPLDCAGCHGGAVDGASRDS